jgi:hypothetical protein
MFRPSDPPRYDYSHSIWWTIQTMKLLCEIWVLIFSALKMEAADSSETLVYTYQNPWHHIPENHNLDLWSPSIWISSVLLHFLSLRFRRTPWHIFISTINLSSFGARDLLSLAYKAQQLQYRYESDAMKAKPTYIRLHARLSLTSPAFVCYGDPPGQVLI